MKINIGFSDVTEIEPLINHGADEFHCGLITQDEIFNHRPNDKSYNLKNIEELKKSVRIVHKNNRKIYFLLNDLSYPIDKYNHILNLAKGVHETGIDGFIVSPLSLIRLLAKEIDTKIILSGTFPLFNSKAIEFIKRFGISRIILPQHLNCCEVKEILDKTDIRTEIFFTNLCKNIDGLCCFHNTALFRKEKDYDRYDENVCSLDFEADNLELKEKIKRIKDYRELGLSDLYSNIKNGVDVLKIGLRGFPLAKKIAILDSANALIKLAEKNDKNEFIKKGLESI